MFCSQELTPVVNTITFLLHSLYYFLSASHFRQPVIAVHCLDIVKVCKCDSTADSLTSSLSSLSAASSVFLASSEPITPSQSDCSFVADEKAQVQPDCVCKSRNTACKSKLAQRECGFVSYKGVIVVLFSTCPIGPTAFSRQCLQGCRETARVCTTLSWWSSKPLKYCSFISSNCLSISSNSLSLS
jgi:hypothetical protein